MDNSSNTNMDELEQTMSHTPLSPEKSYHLTNQLTTPCLAVADTGSTGHFLQQDAMVDAPISDVTPASAPITIEMPNKERIHSSHTCFLRIPGLPREACRSHIVPDLRSGHLISIGQLCDAGCTARLDKATIEIYYHDTLALTGHRDPLTRLWMLNLSDPTATEARTATHACHIARHGTSQADLVAFSHAALGSPAVSTLQRAVNKGLLHGFPGLTATAVRKHPPHTKATAMGHLDQSRQGQRPTEHCPELTPEELIEEYFPTPSGDGNRTHHVFVATTYEQPGQIFTDQTGKFIVPSHRGDVQFLICYDFDSNYISAIPMRNKTAEEHVRAYKEACTRLIRAGLRPRLQRLDNEASTLLKDYMHEQDVTYQLVPPGVHRRNAAERAVRTWKNHFIATLASLPPDFPMRLWNELVPQAELSLNLLRTSRLNPKLSAHAQVHGEYHYDRNPIAPPGTPVVIHEKPDQRRSWDPHGKPGWYLGPRMDGYRTWRVYVSATHSIRTADTLEWFPHTAPMPVASSTDTIKAALRDIARALHNPSPASPLHTLQDSDVETLRALADIFTPETPRHLTPASQDAPTNQPVTPTPPPRDPTPASGTAPPQEESVLPPGLPAAADTAPTPPPAIPTRIPHTGRYQALIDTDDDEEPTPTEATPQEVPVPPLRVETPATQEEAAAPLLRVPADEDATSTPKPSRDVNKPKQRRRSRRKGRRRQKQGPVTRSQTRHLAATVKELQDVDRLAVSHEEIAEMVSDKQFFEQALKAVHPDTGVLSEYKDLRTSSEGQRWELAMSHELGRLAQGNDYGTEGTNSMHFIHKHEVPEGETATYCRIVADYRPQKADPYRIRCTVGGNLLEALGDYSAGACDLVSFKLLINSVLSNPRAKFMCLDLKNFYLNTKLKHDRYMRIRIADIPDDIINRCDLRDKVSNGYVYVKITGGMYGLPEAGQIANEELLAVLGKDGFYESRHTNGLILHKSRPLMFDLCTDDFGVSYENQDDALWLIDLLLKRYELTVDWTGSTFLGLHLDWDYENRTCDISMPGYITKALGVFQHSKPDQPQDQPYPCETPQYGVKVQMTTHDESEPLDKKETTRLQSIVGKFLYSARAVDSSMLVPLSSLAAAQTKGTQQTAKALAQLLDYAATHPEPKVRFKASDMVLWIDSDASYLSEPGSRSRIGGYHFLSDRPKDPDKPPGPDDPPPMFNGAIDVPCQIMSMVLASATEAETAGLFVNTQRGASTRRTLEEMGWPQPQTPVKTDNACAAGIANKTIKQKRSKAMDMRFDWVRDRVKQRQFHIYWKKGEENFADYFTKHHPAEHHRKMRPVYFHSSSYAVDICGEGVLIPAVCPSHGTANDTRPARARPAHMAFAIIADL